MKNPTSDARVRRPPPAVNDCAHMAEALQLAARGLYTTDPNPRVGCVLVRDDRVVGRGWHVRAGEAHAEVNALREAGGRARGATAYVTLEPCSHHGRTPPCADALIAAGVARVVAAMEDPNPQVAGQGLERLKAAGVAVETGVLACEAQALNPGFVARMRRGTPWVRGKLAMSLDGRTAMASGESRWITGDAARRDVQRLRARSSAVMTGIDTVLADDPGLNVRLDAAALGGGDRVRQPLRVVLDSRLRMPRDARLLNLPGETLIIVAAGTDVSPWPPMAGVDIAPVPAAEGRPELRSVLTLLAGRGVNEVLLETGPTLAGAMLQAGLIDELVVYLAPHLMGDAARGLFCLPGLERMADRVNLEFTDVRAVGGDLKLTARVRMAG